jgi:hypothetical protein
VAVQARVVDGVGALGDGGDQRHQLALSSANRRATSAVFIPGS